MTYVALCVVVAASGNISADELAPETDYPAQLADLATWCDQHELASQAELTRNWLPKREPLTDYIFLIPADAALPEGFGESPDAKQWWQRFTALRQAQAEKLFAAAQQAAQEKRPLAALQLARETLRENPDHATARKILGYEQFENRWVWPKAVTWLKAGKIWSDEFGWLPAEHLRKYESGQRYYRGKWIDAAEDARLHGNINSAWQIETEHYQVRTTHSLEEGVKLARRLELLYEVWQTLFVDYYASPAAIEQWFASATGAKGSAGPKPNLARKPFTVVLFRDKPEYVESLRTLQPQVAMSVGTYLDRLKVAYFFAGPEQSPGTLYHEATHQLFREQRPGAIEPGRKNNFWAVEAIACYMESLTEHRLLPGVDYGMYVTLGGASAGRVPAARARLQEPEYLFFKPLREMAPLGMDALQHEPQLPAIYSQSSGLAWFLLHAEGGKYRSAFIELLTAIYTGKANELTLEKLTGLKYEDLDEQYRAFMK